MTRDSYEEQQKIKFTQAKIKQNDGCNIGFPHQKNFKEQAFSLQESLQSNEEED